MFHRGRPLEATTIGGAIRCIEGDPVEFDNCTFHRNSAGNHGGAIYSTNTSPAATNCLFEGNRVDRWGGAFFSGKGIAATALPVSGVTRFLEIAAESS